MNKNIDNWLIELERLTKKFKDACLRAFSSQNAISITDRKNRRYGYLYVRITNVQDLYEPNDHSRR
jgi:hypothetical protein